MLKTFLVFFALGITLCTTARAVNLMDGSVHIAGGVQDSLPLSRYMILVEKRNENSGTYLPKVWRFGNADGSFKIDTGSAGVFRFTPHRMGFTFLSNKTTDQPGKLGPVIMNDRTRYQRVVKAVPDIRPSLFGLYSEGAFLDMTHPQLKGQEPYQFQLIKDFQNFDFVSFSRVHLPIRYIDATRNGLKSYLCVDSNGGRVSQEYPCAGDYAISNQLSLNDLIERLRVASIRNKKVIITNGFYSRIGLNQNGKLVFQNDKRQRSTADPLPLEKEEYQNGFKKLVADMKRLLLKNYRMRLSEAVSAFVLEEENYFPSDTIRGLLAGIYQSATSMNENKDLTVLQWYAHSRCSTAIGDATCNGLGTVKPTLGDGYFIEQYLIHDEQSSGNAVPKEYSHYVEKMSSLKQRLVSNVWATPNWAMLDPSETDPGAGACSTQLSGWEVKNWWNVKGWRQFYTQVTQNIKHRVPSLFYLIGIDSEKCTATAMWRPSSHHNVQTKKALEDFMKAFSEVTIPALKALADSGQTPPDVSELTQMPAWIPKYCPDSSVPGCSE